MDIDRFKIAHCQKLIDLENINMQEFYKIVEITKSALRQIGINPEGMNLYYQRNNNATSILAIQVTKGDIEDKNNYMLNGCQAYLQGSDVACDVFLHSNAKSAQKSVKLANLISKNIVAFFKETEKDLLKNKNFNSSFSITIPLNEKENKETNSIKKLVKRLFTK